MDETAIKAGSELIWLWVAIEQETGKLLHYLYPKKETCLLQRGSCQVWSEHGNHPVSTDGGTWYPQACRFLNLDHHIHSHLEKSLIERTMQYFKDRTLL